MVQYNLYRYDLTKPVPVTVVGGLSLPTTNNPIGQHVIWYQTNGAAQFGELGFPIGAAFAGPIQGTTIQVFDRGIVMTSTKYGAHSITGTLWDKYRADAALRVNLGAVAGEAAQGKDGMTQMFAFGVLSTGLVADAGKPVSLFRFYNEITGAHFYTIDVAERDHVIATWPQFKYEQWIGKAIAGNTAQESGQVLVYRFYNHITGAHFYTTSAAERDHVIATWPDRFNYEGAKFVAYSTQVAGTIPVYRFYNHITGAHFYTTDAAERARVNATWPDRFIDEGIAFYILPK
jgi:hypothetical protein